MGRHMGAWGVGRGALATAMLLAACGGSTTTGNDAGSNSQDAGVDAVATADTGGMADTGGTADANRPGDSALADAVGQDSAGDVGADSTGDAGVDAGTDADDVADTGQGADVTDAAPDAGPGTFACGSTTCQTASEYCFVVEGGVVMLDGGGLHRGTCNALPAACLATPTCGCVEASVPVCHTLCNNIGGGVTVTCEAP